MQQSQNGTPTGCLVIQIKVGDTITIGNDIFLHVKDRRGNFLRVVIKAPTDQKITRAHSKE